MKTIVLVAFFTICYVVCMDLVNKYMSSIDFEMIEEEKEVAVSSNIYTVSISGMVVNPGTYTVTKDSNMGYLITLAGGLQENVDVTSFNSNAPLEDGGSYYISYKRVDENNNSIKISLNTATEAELVSLPYIGTVYARTIIENRINYGKFLKIEDVKRVPGIKDKVFESIKDLICL